MTNITLCNKASRMHYTGSARQSISLYKRKSEHLYQKTLNASTVRLRLCSQYRSFFIGLKFRFLIFYIFNEVVQNVQTILKFQQLVYIHNNPHVVVHTCQLNAVISSKAAWLHVLFPDCLEQRFLYPHLCDCCPSTCTVCLLFQTVRCSDDNRQYVHTHRSQRLKN